MDMPTNDIKWVDLLGSYQSCQPDHFFEKFLKFQ